MSIETRLRSTTSESAGGGGGSGAPTDATYITVSLNANLTSERRLVGTSSQVHTVDNGANSTLELHTPQNISTTDSPTFNRMTLSGYTDTGSLFFVGAGGALNTDSTNLVWEDSSNFLGVGTRTPAYPLDVQYTYAATNSQQSIFRVKVAPSGSGGNCDVLMGGYNLPANGSFFIQSSDASNSGIMFRTRDAGGSTADRVYIDGEGDMGIYAGTSTNEAKVGGILNVNVVTVGNVGTGEDNLQSYTIPANTLVTNGDQIEFYGAGEFANNGNSKRVRVYFGSQTIFDSGALVTSSSNWAVCGSIIRTGVSAQRATVSWSSNASPLPSSSNYVEPAESTTGGIIIKFTGEATSDNDIESHILVTKWYPNTT